jgi:hypothetical protein
MNQETSLHRLVYVSTSIDKLSQEVLQEILAVSRRNNALKDITGILVYNDGNILQVLEGNKRDLHRLFGKISQDHRHFGCIILQDTASDTRSFADWSMGFRSVSHIEFIQLEGYWDLRSKNLPLINDESEDTVRTILNMFVEHNK